MTENKTVKKLREESDNVYSFIKFFLFLYGCFILFPTFFLIACLLTRNGIAAALLDPSSGNALERALAFLLDAYIEGDLVNPEGKLLILRVAGSLLPGIFSNALMFYIFNCLAKIFMNMNKGETPFTLENASHWKKCSRIFAVLATIQFLISFVAPGFIFSILFPLMATCFFQALCLIFEYGSQLQQESDETL